MIMIMQALDLNLGLDDVSLGQYAFLHKIWMLFGVRIYIHQLNFFKDT
jgi:hypothetical protein